MRVSVLLAGVAGLVCGPAAATDEPLPNLGQRLFKLTPEQFQHSATIKDDQLETVATITTEPGFKKNRGLVFLGKNDCFLRAFIDKKSGATTYQLYGQVADWTTDRDQYKSVNYETPNGPRAAALLNLGRTKDCSMRGWTGHCSYYESVAVPIDEALLGQFAAQYEPGQKAAWYFRFKAQSGAEYTDGLSSAEIAGLLAAVADYRRAHHLPAPAARITGR